MDNYELDKKAKELVDTEHPYNLARRVVELESTADPRGKVVVIRSKFDGRTLTGKCRKEHDWLAGCPVVDTDEGLKDIGYYWELVKILKEAP